MKHYAGLDVSVKETSVCIVDESGTPLRRRIINRASAGLMGTAALLLARTEKAAWRRDCKSHKMEHIAMLGRRPDKSAPAK